MPQITAAAVKALRDRTGLPMMECKTALSESGGDEDAAITWLRERGAKTMEKRSERETSFGRMGIYLGLEPEVGAMVELKCESAPVAQHEEFIQLADDLAHQLATGPGASTVDELLDQPSPSQTDSTLREVKDDLCNRIREVFKVERMVVIDGPCGGYSHNATIISGVLVKIEGGNAAAAKDVAMHVAALSPKALSADELDSSLVDQERQILSEAARKEGKPEQIIEKMVEGRMRNFYAEHVLMEQPFVKEQKLTVRKFAEQNNMKILQFVHWVLGEE